MINCGLMLGATVRHVTRRLMVPARVEPPYALGARDQWEAEMAEHMNQ